MSTQEHRAFDDAVVAFGQPATPTARPQLTSSPLLAAVGRAGTTHIYGDTADAGELAALITTASGAIFREIDGNTANQPLVHKVIKRYLEGGDSATWARRLRELQPGLTGDAAQHPALRDRLRAHRQRRGTRLRGWPRVGGEPAAAHAARWRRRSRRSASAATCAAWYRRASSRCRSRRTRRTAS